MNQVLMILLSDGLRLPSGMVADSPYRCLIYCKVPDEWVEGDIPESTELWLKGLSLKPDKLEGLLEQLYGVAWRSGNSDGSQYVVRGLGARLLNPLRDGEKPWQLDDPNNKQFRFFHYVADGDRRFKLV